ncbi:MAG: TatD family hydrolase [Planctomycetota bacterium]|nr:TatD family hydrolase [Planctomycetota bacterium]
MGTEEDDASETRWIDIGANLTSNQFKRDLDQVIARAEAAGVTRMVVTGTDAAGSAEALALARSARGLWCTAGVHPHHASDLSSAVLARLEALTAQPEVVAVGECGLDFNRDYSPRGDQIAAFETQLALGARSGLPLFLHQRDAHDVFLGMLRDAWPDLRAGAVVHCFTEGPAEAEDYLDLGCHLGVTGWVCDERRGDALRAAVPLIPGDRLMLETDAPYLLPRTIEPRPATRRNEPMHMAWIGRAVAELRGEPVEEVARRAWTTTSAFFGLETTG